MRRINRGKIIGNEYVKEVSFSTAVLWKNRELSLPLEEMMKIRQGNVTKLRFVDKKKGEDWVFSTDDLTRHAKYKKEGQEPQFYWNIALKKVERHK